MIQELPRLETYQGLLAYTRRRIRDLEAENARLRKLAMGLANRLADCAEIFAAKAEKKERRNA